MSNPSKNLYLFTFENKSNFEVECAIAQRLQVELKEGILFNGFMSDGVYPLSVVKMLCEKYRIPFTCSPINGNTPRIDSALDIVSFFKPQTTPIVNAGYACIKYHSPDPKILNGLGIKVSEFRI